MEDRRIVQRGELMQQILAVGLGGFVGAISRYVLSGMVMHFVQEKLGRTFPAGTLVVNVLGCLIIGVLMAYVLAQQLSDNMQLFLITGILGSLTTFSTFGYETVALIQNSEPQLAFWNVAANVCIGFAAVSAGMILAKSFGV